MAITLHAVCLQMFGMFVRSSTVVEVPDKYGHHVACVTRSDVWVEVERTAMATVARNDSSEGIRC